MCFRFCEEENTNLAPMYFKYITEVYKDVEIVAIVEDRVDSDTQDFIDRREFERNLRSI